MNVINQTDFYTAKLDFEIDSWDLFAALQAGDNIVVIDARSQQAFDREHIPDASHFAHREMTPDALQKLAKEPLYVTYCDGIGCNASTKAALALAAQGFRVKELLGGLDWWRRDGYQTHGEHASEGRNVQCGC